MAKKRKEIIENYVENLLVELGRKLRAKEMDTLGILGDRVNLTEEEDLAYEYVLMKIDNDKQVYALNRYLNAETLEHKDIQKKIGISEPTYYKRRKEFIEGLDGYLTTKGYGYDNASNVDRYDLPNRLTLGKYIKFGRDFVYEEPDGGDYYEIYGGAEGLERYRIIRVVKDLELFEMMAEGDETVTVDVISVEKVQVLDNYGVGLLVSVNENKYEDYMDVGFVLNHLEVAIVEELGDERATELLQQDTIFEFK